MKHVLLCSFLLSTLSSFAGGYEKAVMWSGKWGALGGAAAGAVSGADSILFNPAGLVNGANQEISFNISPTVSKFEGPALVDNADDSGETTMTIIPGLTYKKNLNEKMSLGVGVYAVAGSKSEYKDINSGSLVKDVSSSVQAAELSLGIGYKLNTNWNLGLGLRATQAKANIATFSSATAHLEGKNLVGTDFGGFRLGAQYRDDADHWGLGIVYRSEVKLDLKDGDATLTVPGNTFSGDIEAENYLPQTLAVGTWYKINEKAKLFTELTWYNYSKNEEIKIRQNTTGSYSSSKLDQQWKDMYALKIGYEQNSDNGFVYRGGFALTTQVTPNKYARNTFSAPGDAYSLHGGLGKTFGNSTIDLGLELVQSSGEGESPANDGDYVSKATAVHAGYKYAF